MVVPDGEHEDHTLLKSSTHGGKATLISKLVGIAKCGLLSSAEVVGDRVTGDTSNVSVGVGDDNAILDIEALNLAQGSRGGTILHNVNCGSL